MACASQLNTAKVCVEGDPATCSCFVPPFDTNFVEKVTGAYRMTMAFEVPGDPAFCDRANENVCTMVETEGNCCCQAEVQEYIKCAFASELGPTFGAADCQASGCGAAEEEGGGGGGSSMIMIVAIVVVLLLCCCGGFFYRRRRQQQNDKSKSSETDSSFETGDIESLGSEKRSKNRKGPGSKRGFEYDSDSDFSDVESARGKKQKGKKKSGGSRKGFDSDSDDDSWDDFQSKKKHGRDGKKKRRDSDSVCDSDSSSSDTRRRRKNKKSLKRSNSKKRLDYSDSESVDSRSESRRSKPLKRSNSKKRFDDSDSDRSEPLKRSSSKKRLDDSDSDESDSRRSKPLKRGSSKKRLDDSDSESEYRKPKQTVEESVRQARTILKSVKKSKDADVTVEVQQVMNSEMSALIAQLKTQREEMERRLKESETEATKLRLEREASRRQIVELETRKNDTEARMAETKREVKELQAKSAVETANQTSENILVAAELEKVRMEREEMSKMIKKLEKAKTSMEDRLEKAAQETIALQTEKEVANRRVTEVEKEREALRQRLSKIEQTRSEIESKLNDAEEEARQLKEEKKMKTQEIRDMRSSQHNRSTINIAEVERKNITKNLKRVSEEKQQMLDMMAQLDSSRHRLQGLVDDDEMSLQVGSVFGAPAGPMGMTIEEDRPAGWLGNTISNRSFNNLNEAASMGSGYETRASSRRTRDPSERSTRSIGDLSDEGGNSLSEKRQKARMSERKLRSKMERSRSGRSVGSCSTDGHGDEPPSLSRRSRR